MSDKHTSGLHLPNLSISNFRGIGHLSIGKMGRVTLLAGRNGVGKTTILEAVRLYAARGSHFVLHELLNRREELAVPGEMGHDSVVAPDYAALFHGRTVTRGRPIIIGPTSGADRLHIGLSTPSESSSYQQSLFGDFPGEAKVLVLRIAYGDRQRWLPWLPVTHGRHRDWSTGGRYVRAVQRGLFEDEDWPVINCESLGPGLPGNTKLARFWDGVALTQEENFALEALRLTGDGIMRVAVVGDEDKRHRGLGRRILVKHRDHPRPVPLKSLGDGVTRLFAAALALANSRDGFLLVDEAENGIHYSLQRDFWHMMLRAAHKNNVQVMATTHSLDCVAGFAEAAAAATEAEGVLVRLEWEGGGVRAVQYTEQELNTVAKQNIEVR